MSENLNKRAEWLDSLRSKGIAEKLTLEEAQNIISIWGRHLEFTGAFRIIFGLNTPRSVLPYPIEILQGAINKMEAYYYKHGQHKMVRTLEETEMSLMQYADDEEAFEEMKLLFKKDDWIASIVKTLPKHQIDQANNGYVVDGELWDLSKDRIEELLRDN